jgi:hypothetical protein
LSLNVSISLPGKSDNFTYNIGQLSHNGLFEQEMIHSASRKNFHFDKITKFLLVYRGKKGGGI